MIGGRSPQTPCVAPLRFLPFGGPFRGRCSAMIGGRSPQTPCVAPLLFCYSAGCFVFREHWRSCPCPADVFFGTPGALGASGAPGNGFWKAAGGAMAVRLPAHVCLCGRGPCVGCVGGRRCGLGGVRRGFAPRRAFFCPDGCNLQPRRRGRRFPEFSSLESISKDVGLKSI